MSDEVLLPPVNFGIVSEGLYRSGYPTKLTYPYVEGLGLKSMM